MNYLKLVIQIADKHQEPLIADLACRPFTGFQCQGHDLIAYIAQENFGDDVRIWLQSLLDDYPGESLIKSEEIIADQNWNAQWESSIKPQQIGAFWVAPSWTTEQAPEDKIPIIINPQMSFGTGYHETTRLMLNMLSSTIKPGMRVVDAGTGTGILAIAAAKLGAKSLLAFDTDSWSIRNAKENIEQNDSSNSITLQRGSAEVMPSGIRYNVILANIQLNPILAMLPDFAQALKDEGMLLLSGLLEESVFKVKKKASDLHFVLQEERRENKWIALKFQKLVDT